MLSGVLLGCPRLACRSSTSVYTPNGDTCSRLVEVKQGDKYFSRPDGTFHVRTRLFTSCFLVLSLFFMCLRLFTSCVRLFTSVLFFSRPLCFFHAFLMFYLCFASSAVFVHVRFAFFMPFLYLFCVCPRPLCLFSCIFLVRFAFCHYLS